MSRKRRWVDGDVVSDDGDLMLRGHLTVEEFNKILEELGYEDPVASVHHFYVRAIPAQPEDEYPFWIHGWGNKPSRGAFAVTERGGEG